VRENLIPEAVRKIQQVFCAEAVAVSDMSVVTAATCDTSLRSIPIVLMGRSKAAGWSGVRPPTLCLSIFRR
jgi:hypothetical protein